MCIRDRERRENAVYGHVHALRLFTVDVQEKLGRVRLIRAAEMCIRDRSITGLSGMAGQIGSVLFQTAVGFTLSWFAAQGNASHGYDIILSLIHIVTAGWYRKEDKPSNGLLIKALIHGWKELPEDGREKMIPIF